MASRSKKRGPYSGDSRTSKWRKKDHLNESGDSSVNDVDIAIDDVESDVEENDKFVPDVFDIMVEEMLETERNKHNYDTDIGNPGEETDMESEPIYPGSRLTVSMSMLLIVTFVMRHNLTGVALCDLLTLIEMHCPPDNICRATLAMYRDFFRKLKTPLVYNYFCEKCYFNIGSTYKILCPNCSSTHVKHFITIPLKNQLETILKRPGVLDIIRRNKVQRSKQGSLSSIRDVYDGTVYKTHFDTSGYFHGTTDEEKKFQLHISLQINTDGVAIFKSSKYGVWPVYATVNELPPDARFTRENRIFLGLWFGNQKPSMKLLFGSFLEEFRSFFKGIAILLNMEEIKIRAILLSCIADAPARCLMMDFVQFNGKFGCLCCYSPGETFAITETGNCHIYPFNSENYEGHDRLRTAEETIHFAHKVEKSYFTGRRRDPVPEMGVKGMSFLSSFPRFNLIRGTGIDYMHCILLGVLKMIIGLWIDLDHKDKPWSIRPSIEILNERIQKLSPHCLISRLPKNIDEYSDWKASEYRTFLLYYSLPLLEDILQPIYYTHYSNLVLGTFLLLKTSISQAELDLARCCFKRFCIQLEGLYSERYATFNVHCLLHLCLKVEELGPLWSQSCFFYEGLNGDLRNQFHGTQQIDLQIATAVCVQNKIPELLEKLQDGEIKSFYLRMLAPLKNQSERTKIGYDTFLVGSTKLFDPGQTIRDLLEKQFGNIAEFYVFYRVFHKKIMLYSEEYKPVKRRNSYTFRCKTGICQIRYFVKCTTEHGYKFAAITKNLHVHNLKTNIAEVSIGLTNVRLINDIEEPVMFIDIHKGKKFVAFFQTLLKEIDICTWYLVH